MGRKVKTLWLILGLCWIAKAGTTLTINNASLVLGNVSVAIAPLSSQTIAAASCSRTDVEAAISAASNGDTVTIPAGTCTWTNVLVITKAITLQGAGIGNTIIKDGQQTYGEYIMDWTLVANRTSRMTGIEFQDDGATNNAPRFRFSGTNLDARRLRVDNCYFNQLNASCTVLASLARRVFVSAQIPAIRL